MRHTRLIFALVVFCATAISVTAQNNNPDISKEGQRIRKLVVNYGFGHRITVKLKGGSTYHGTVGMLDDVTFQVNEVDMQKVVSIRYEDVQKVQGDYGNKGAFGTRVNPTTNKIVFFGGLGALAVLIFLFVPRT